MGIVAKLLPGWALVGFILFLAMTGIGIAYGMERAFLLRLQAQQALCQVAIEENTRPLSPVEDAE